MTNEKIAQALEDLGLPIYQDRIPEEEIENYDYIVYSESAIRKKDCKYYQDIGVAWFSKEKTNDNYFEIDIIEKMESLGLVMNGDGSYDNFKSAKTNALVNAVTMTFTRFIKKK